MVYRKRIEAVFLEMIVAIIPTLPIKKDPESL